jgi:cytochrome c oxidase assembly protein subunit 11
MATRLEDRRQGSGRRNRIMALACFGVVAGMVGLAYASVPLYRIFCQVTGYGGTTRAAVEAPAQPIARMVTVRFDANAAKALGWRFSAPGEAQHLAIGETGMAYFHAVNDSARTVTGTATFNVTPDWAGSYFNKIECFCFTEQTLAPGEAVDMPVVFFIDPEIVEERAAGGDITITLSYSFYPAAGTRPSAAGESGAPARRNQKAGNKTGDDAHG